MTLVLLCIVCHLKHRADIILNTQMAEHRCLLSKVAHTKLRTLIDWQLSKLTDLSIILLKEDSTPIWLDKTHYHIERGRLSRSIRSKQSDNLALIDLYRDMIYYGTRLVSLD